MTMTELLLLSIGLGADACAVSMTDGMTVQKRSCKSALMIAVCFGLMQGMMPLLGYLAGMNFTAKIAAYDHLIALLLLSGIGLKQITEAASADSESLPKLSIRLILLQGIATSLDALAVGVSLAAFPSTNIITAAGIIAFTAFLMSFTGYFIGRKCGRMLGRKAQVCGGIILIGIGLHIFLSHIRA